MTNEELKSKVLELCVEIRDEARLQASVPPINSKEESQDQENLERLFNEIENLFEEEEEEEELELTEKGMIFLLQKDIEVLERRLDQHVQVHLALAKSLETAAEEIHKLKQGS